MFINHNKFFTNIFLNDRYYKILSLKNNFCQNIQKPNLLELGYIFPEDPNNNFKILILSLFLGSFMRFKNRKK